MQYDWSSDFRLLATIVGLAQYTTEAGFNYVNPAQPPNIHLSNIACGTALHIHTWEADNDLQRRNYAVFGGFKIGICRNLRDALDLRYYEQVRETTFGYKRRTFRHYIEHLEEYWCMLNCKTIESLKQNWKCK